MYVDELLGQQAVDMDFFENNHQGQGTFLARWLRKCKKFSNWGVREYPNN